MKHSAMGAGVLLFALTGLTSSVQAEGGRYVPRTERGQAAGQIVKKWAGYVQKVYGTSPQRWAAAMRDTFAEASLVNMKDAADRKTYEAMMGTLLGQGTTDGKVIDMMAKAGDSPGVMSLGSASEDLVYTMVTPCRIMDSRVAGGRLSGGVARSIAVHGANFTSQGGSASTCNIPADPSAVAINVVAIAPDLGGFMTIYPAGATRPTASSLNYEAGGILANEVIARTTLGQPADLSVFSQYGTDVVVDIVGYFMAPEATPVQCTTVSNSRSLPAGYDAWAFTTESCPTGYAPVSAYCWKPSPSDGVYLTGQGANANGFCGWRNLSGAAQTVYEGSRCCRIPGR